MTLAVRYDLIASLWSASALAAGIDDAARPIGAVALMHVAGIDVPYVTAAFAMLGVLLSRPISPPGDYPLTRLQAVCVNLICALLVLAWVIESRPSLLFAFVMSIGVGFSGFALIQLAGSQALDLVTRVFAAIFPRGNDNA